ncbi:MAG: hypothetical protein L0I17_03925 [Actinomycetia bacterium]|nr:hypothetical protein [Actinomycetes bacterium]
MAAEYVHVTGRFQAPVAARGEQPEPLEGWVGFVPKFASARTSDAVVLPATVKVPLDAAGELAWDDGSPGVWLLAPASTPDIEWSWEVQPHLRFDGQSLWMRPFQLAVVAGQTADLAALAGMPLPEPDDQEPAQPGAAAGLGVQDNGDGTVTISSATAADGTATIG